MLDVVRRRVRADLENEPDIYRRRRPNLERRAIEARDVAVSTLPWAIRNPVKVLAVWLDWYQVNARLEWDDDAARALRIALGVAKKHGVAPFRWRGLEAQVKARPRSREGLLQCGTFRLAFTLPEVREPGAEPETIVWNANLTWEHDALTTAGIHRVGPYTAAILSRLGRVLEWHIVRFDLAADVAGWALEDGESTRLVKRGHSKVADYYGVETTEFSRGTHRLGWMVSPGNEISVRSYAKDIQARTQLGPDAIVGLARVWSAAGWRVGDPVRRVEVQVRGAALEEMSARDPMRLAEVADRVWLYVVERWLRMIDRERKATRLSRCPIDHRWAMLRHVRFAVLDAAREVIPVERSRRRGGARAEQTLGCVLSTLAQAGALPDLPVTAEVWARQADHEAAADVVRDVIRDAFVRASNVVSDALLDARQAHGVVERLFTAIDARRFRFAEWEPEMKERAFVPKEIVEAADQYWTELRAQEAA